MSEAPDLSRRQSATLPTLLQLAATLLLLFGITYLTVSATPDALTETRVAVLIGFVLLVASLAGSLAAGVGLPRITGFLVVGILAGPSVVGQLVAPGAEPILTQATVEQLSLIDEFALALIAMLAGGELKLGELRSAARSIVLTTLGVTLVVWVGVGVTVVLARPLMPFLDGLPFGTVLGVALLLGIWAANSSPDLTVAVIEETGARGRLTDVILGVTIVKDVLVIVLFTLTMALVTPLVNPGEAFEPAVLLDLAREVGGALVVGGVLGWVFSLYLSAEEERPPIATFLFAYVVVVIANRLHVELLLTGVAAGFVIENLSEAGDRMIRGIESVSVVIFAFFFTVAGARLDLSAVGRFWQAALILLVSRLAFTYLGAKLGTRYAGADERVRVRTWQGLISQGGVTLGLVLLIGRNFPEVGQGVVALGMAVIIGNILAGPVILKRALSGEA